jgi:cyclohexa-1,5-dienecarbonyl-CoA hydratase
MNRMENTKDTTTAAATVKWSVESGVGTLTVCHPPLNILTRAVLEELTAALNQLADDSRLCVLLLAADGKHFSVGADVGEHLPPEYRELIPKFMTAIRTLREFPLPVVAAVRGRCLGGGFELVQAADIVVAGEGASFGQPEIALGVSPPAACALLPERCHPGVAAELVFTGDAIGATEAQDAGVVTHVVPDGDVEAHALHLAERMARHSGAALRCTKRALRASAAPRVTAALCAAEKIYIDDLMQTEDAVEGLRAFVEKRPPVWKHK